MHDAATAPIALHGGKCPSVGAVAAGRRRRVLELREEVEPQLEGACSSAQHSAAAEKDAEKAPSTPNGATNCTRLRLSRNGTTGAAPAAAGAAGSQTR